MENSIALSIQRFARETPEQTVFICGSQTCTYAQLAMYNRKAARWLRDRGIRPGDRVLVEADHNLPYIYFWYGVQLLGITFVPVEKNTPDSRIREIAESLGIRMVVTLEPRPELDGAEDLGSVFCQLSAYADAPIGVDPDPSSLAEILFTTGTTGKSKGVMVSYKNQINIALAGIETTNIQQDNIWLIPTPMNHAAGLRKTHIAMAVGSTVCLLEGFRNFKLYFDTIEEHKVTSLYLPPSAIHLLLAVGAAKFAKLNGQLRFIYSSSTAYPEADKEKMRKLMPDVYMYNAFGASEVGVACTDEFCVSGGSQYTGSVGRPNSLSTILLLDADGNVMSDASAQNPGLIAVRSESVMQGYWNDPEQTAKAIRDGMLVMSDLGYFAPNGELILVGRSNDTINLGGLKISPTEVEEVVARVDCVDESLLIPVTRGGNVSLKLLVKLKDGAELDEAAIYAAIAKSLEPYKTPKQIVVIDSILRTFNGKIDRKEMIRIYA